MPVLVLTARDGWAEKVAGIDAGADDYLTKPFHTEELLARVRALIRRAQGLASPLLQHGPLALDTRSSRVTCQGQPVVLTSHEFRLLAYLMHRPAPSTPCAAWATGWRCCCRACCSPACSAST